MNWSLLQTDPRGSAGSAGAAEDGDDDHAEQSKTLTQWLGQSRKAELLSLLRNRTDNLDKLTQEGAIDLREYILASPDATKEPKRTQKKTVVAAKNVTATHVAASGAVKKWNVGEVTERRLQTHKSSKPPQAVLRERDELRSWHDSKTTPALKDELRKRVIRFVRGRKADSVQLLVDDDRKAVAKEWVEGTRPEGTELIALFARLTNSTRSSTVTRKVVPMGNPKLVPRYLKTYSLPPGHL
jgi:hypothetical protein